MDELLSSFVLFKKIRAPALPASLLAIEEDIFACC
jgi:hypothetical protein